MTNFRKWKLQNEGYQGNATVSCREQKTLREGDEPVTSILMSKEVVVGSKVKSVAEASAYRAEGKSLVVLQVNCTIVCNKAMELWNLVDMDSPDVQARNHGLRKILTMLNSSGMILQLSGGIGLPVVVGFLSVLKISLPLRSYEWMMMR